MRGNWVKDYRSRLVSAKKRRTRPVLLVLFCALAAVPAAVLADAPPHAKVVLLLVSGLSYDDLRAGGPLPHVRQLAEAGGVALLNTAVSGETTEAAAYLSVGGSERLSAPSAAVFPSESGGETRAASAAELAAQAFTTDHPQARGIYRRRYGHGPDNDAAILHTGLPALQKVQPSPARAQQIGALGDALERTGLRVAVYGDWRAVLVAMNRRGVVPGGVLGEAIDPQTLTRLLPNADVLIVNTPDAPSFDALAGALLPRLTSRAESLTVLAASVAPPRDPGSGKWARLGFVAAAGAGIPALSPGSLLTSGTTRTRGLAANIDLAPALLQAAGVDRALPGAGGRRLRSIAVPGDAWAVVAGMDRQVNATTRATAPVLIGYAVFAIGSCLLSTWVLLRGSGGGGTDRRLIALSRFCVLMSAAALIALLPVGIIAPSPPWLYGSFVLILSGLFAGAALLLGRRLAVPPLAVLLIGTTIAVCVDAFFGSPLVSRALLSGYFLPGIRFYGIGNEYMGLVIGAAITGVCLFGPALGAPRTGRVAASLWTVTLLVIVLPWWGAKAGGAVTATVAFVTAGFALRGGGGAQRLKARHIGTAFAAAAVALVLLSVLDRARPGDAQTHVGAAVAAGQERGVSALVEIAVRKVRMNVGLALTPYTFAALAGLLPVWWLLSRGSLGGRATKTLAKRPLLYRVALPAAGWGALTALVFNDSGIVAALLLLAPPTTAVIDGMLCDSLP